jgi:hypothetical protein
MTVPSHTARASEARRTADCERRWAAVERSRAGNADPGVAALHLSAARLHDDSADAHERLAVRLEQHGKRVVWYPPHDG